MIAQEIENHNILDLSSKNHSVAFADSSERVEQGTIEDCHAQLDGQPALGICDTSKDVQKPSRDLSDKQELEALKLELISLRLKVSEYESQEALNNQEFDVSYSNDDYLDQGEFSPLLLTRGVQGATLPLTPNQKTVIDWLTFSAKESVSILQQFINQVIPGCIFLPCKYGIQGYKRAIDISLNGEQLGKIGYMGTTTKNCLILTGNGTSKVKDWGLYTYLLSLLDDYSISQIHLALDDYDGSFMNHDSAKLAYDQGKFKSKKARVNPSLSWDGGSTGTGVNKGLTWNIGKTKGCSKSITLYEKGLEQFYGLFGKLPDDQKDILIPKLTLADLNNPDIPNTIKLDTGIYKWYRAEVKFHNTDTKLVIEMILDRDKYFAGAYPFCEEVLPMLDTKVPPRLPNSLEVELEQMLLNCGNSYGSTLYTSLCIAKNQDKDLREHCVQIVEKIIENHHRLNQKIIKAGGLNEIQPFDIKELKAT